MYLDNYSGGGSCTDYDTIIIEVEAGGWEEAEDKAEVIFEEKFGLTPYGCTCECCGSDYSIIVLDNEEDLEEFLKKDKRFTALVKKDGSTEIQNR